MSTSPSTPDRAAEAAIGEVLGAEAAAREAVALCDRQAEQICRQARLECKRIAQRTDARIERVRRSIASHAEQRIAALETEARACSGAPAEDTFPTSLIEAAVATLAAELSGGLDGGQP